MQLAINFFSFGMSVSAYGSIRVPPARASQASTSEGLHARPDFAKASSGRLRMLRYSVAASAGRAQTPSLATEPRLQKPFQSAAKALQ